MPRVPYDIVKSIKVISCVAAEQVTFILFKLKQVSYVVVKFRSWSCSKGCSRTNCCQILSCMKVFLQYILNFIILETSVYVRGIERLRGGSFSTTLLFALIFRITKEFRFYEQRRPLINILPIPYSNQLLFYLIWIAFDILLWKYICNTLWT